MAETTAQSPFVETITRLKERFGLPEDQVADMAALIERHMKQHFRIRAMYEENGYTLAPPVLVCVDSPFEGFVWEWQSEVLDG